MGEGSTGGEAKKAPGIDTELSMSEVLNTVSHDIRAALAVTSGAAHELASPQASIGDVERQLVAMIQRGNDRLARLAGSLVHLAEMWEGGLELRQGRVDLCLLVRQVTEELRVKQGNRIKLELALPETELWAVLDVERSRQVMGAVLGWSIATARQLVTVSLTADPAGVVIIDDDGPPRGDRGRAVGGDAGKRVSSVALAFAISDAVLKAQGGGLETEVLGDGGFRVRLQLTG